MPQKNIFRWTVGGFSSWTGLEVLKESVRLTQETLGKDKFDWFVCYNNMDKRFLKGLNAELWEQKWSDLPLPLPENKELDSRAKNAIWKVSPARINVDVREIICDNDLILYNDFRDLKNFLKYDDCVLLLDDPLRFFGRFSHLLPNNIQLNSGFIGLPAGYKFGDELSSYWKSHDSMPIDGLDTEQGFIMSTLYNSPLRKIIIDRKTIVELHPDGLWRGWHDANHGQRYQFTGKEAGIHFVEINRVPEHLPWQDFKNFKRIRKIHI